MSVTIETDRLYTPDDLLGMPDGERFELIDGHLVEPNVSVLSNWVDGELLYWIRTYLKSNAIGWLFTSGNMYRCFPHKPNMIRKPDMSFIRRERFRAEDYAANIATTAPDLAVEIVSPNDEAEDLEIKIGDYQEAGIPLVWIIYPIARTARVHRLDGTITGIKEADELDGEDVLPGFRCRLGDLFPTPPKSDD